MRGLAREVEAVGGISIERHAITQQIADAIRTFPGDEIGDVFVDDACACQNRIGGVLLWTVLLADGSSDPALRPCTRRAFTERNG